MREFFELFWLNLVVKKRLLVENLQIISHYYSKAPFRKADLALLWKYFFVSPYRISKKFLLKAGASDPYAYGETPLTTLDFIVRSCEITQEDHVFELGSGRGRGCFWLACFFGCRAVGIEYIPDFVKKANQVKDQLKIEDVEFRMGDILEADYSGATVIYLYGTCFEESFLKKLIKRFAEVPEGTKIITISYPLTDYSEGLFTVVKKFEAPFTWGWGDVYLQVRKSEAVKK